MPTLYQLSDQYLKILSALSDEEELTEEQIIELLGDDWRENPEYEFLT